MRPRWEWRLENEAGQVLDRPTSPVFDARYDAEEWLGDRWRALADQRVRRAVLLNEGTPVPPAIALPAA
ncbi:MAG TPA: hypothetical protein VGC04_05345 [Cellulomonas sp.]